MATFDSQDKTGVPASIPNTGNFESVNSFTIFGSAGNPTAGAGSTFYRHTYRDGDWAIIKYEFYNVAAGSAGSGDYLFPIPTGLSIDYSRANVTIAGSANSGYCGAGTISINGSQWTMSGWTANNGVYSNKVGFYIADPNNANTGWGGAGLANLGVANLRISAMVRVPILDWVNTAYLLSGTGLATATKPGALSLYDEGTFSPTFPGATNMTGTPTGSLGRYTRIGRQVFFSVQVTGSFAHVSNATYTVFALGNLPYAMGDVAGASAKSIQGQVCISGTNQPIILYGAVVDNSGGDAVTIAAIWTANTAIGAFTNILISGSYSI